LIKNITWLACLLLYVGFSASTFANYDTWLNKTSISPWLDESVYQLPTQLVIPVAKSELQKAIEMLKNNQIIKIDYHTAAQLVGINAINPDYLLFKAYSEAEQKAKNKNEEAKDPFFAGNAAKRMQKEANDYYRYAAYTKTLHGKLKAYLVRALVLNEATGGFSVYSKGSELWIYHHSLGKEFGPIKRYPIILFLEKQPTNIYIDTGMAQ